MRFLFVDAIIDSTPKSKIRGVKQVGINDPWLTRDHNGYACMIGSLVGETLGQLAAWNVMAANDFTARPVAGIVASCEMIRPVYAGETLLLESVIDDLDDKAVQYHSQAFVGQELVCRIDGALGPLLPMEQFIDVDTVRQQYQRIYRPYDWALFANLPPLKQKSLLPAHRDMLPRFDEIIESIPQKSMSATQRISGLAPWVCDHFPLKPVLPMTMLLASISDLAIGFARECGLSNPALKALRRIKMNEFVQPGDVLNCTLKVKELDDGRLVLQSISEVFGKRVCVLELMIESTPVN